MRAPGVCRAAAEEPVDNFRGAARISATIALMPSSSPARRARPAWFDLRLVIGLVLVAVSVAGVAWVVQQARITTPVLVAAGALVPGQQLTAADVVEVDANLGVGVDRYLTPGDVDGGLVVTRAVGEGEFIASGATTAEDDGSRTRVVVASALEVPGDLAPGDAVELWAAPAEGGGAYGEPVIVVSEAALASIISDEGVMASGGVSLELVIDRDAVADVLHHVAGGSAMSVVPIVAPGAP